jgi:hypothetical protein
MRGDGANSAWFQPGSRGANSLRETLQKRRQGGVCAMQRNETAVLAAVPPLANGSIGLLNVHRADQPRPGDDAPQHRKGITYGKTDEFGYNTGEDPVPVHDLHATV